MTDNVIILLELNASIISGYGKFCALLLFSSIFPVCTVAVRRMCQEH